MKLRRLLEVAAPPIIGLFILVIAGTILFSILENIDLFDALYWTITVLSTVGFGDITPKTIGGKILFIFLIVFGLTLFGYFLSQVSTLLSEERMRRMFYNIYGFLRFDGGKYNNHVLLLGWNDFIKSAYEELRSNNVPAYIILNDEETAKQLYREGYETFVGSISDNEFIEKISLKNARAIIIAYDDMTKTIVEVLRIRKIDGRVKVIVLNYEEELTDVLRQAGVDHSINIADIGGRILASTVFEEHAAEVTIDLLSRGGLDIVEFTVGRNIAGKTLGEVKEKLRGEVVSIYARGRYIQMPKEDMVLREGDKIIAVGDSNELDLSRRFIEE